MKFTEFVFSTCSNIASSVGFSKETICVFSFPNSHLHSSRTIGNDFFAFNFNLYQFQIKTHFGLLVPKLTNYLIKEHYTPF